VTPRLRIKLLRTGLEISNWEEEDTPGAGAPKTVLAKENIDLVHDMFLIN
jgi:hypothetical protein